MLGVSEGQGLAEQGPTSPYSKWYVVALPWGMTRPLICAVVVLRTGAPAVSARAGAGSVLKGSSAVTIGVANLRVATSRTR